MYKVIHVDPNGCEYEVGNCSTEQEARILAGNTLRSYCELEEQIEHIVSAMDLSSESHVLKMQEFLKELDAEKIKKYCEDFNENLTDAILIIGPSEFEVAYFAELSFSRKSGFYYEICSNG